MRFAIRFLPFLLLLSCSSPQKPQKELFKEDLQNNLLTPELKTLSQQNINSANNILLLLPLSGPNKEIGEDIFNTSILLLHENNCSNINFIVKDSSKDVNEWAKELQNIKITSIIGPVFSNEAKKAGVLFPDIPIFSLSNNPEINNSHTFACGISPQHELKTLTKYMIANKKDDLIIFGADCDFCNRMIRFVKSEFLSYNRNPDNIKTIIYEKISKKDALDIIYSYKKKSVLILDPFLKLAQLRDVNVFTLSSIAISDPKSWEGAIFSYESSDNQENFLEKYKSVYKRAPGVLSMVSYDVLKAVLNSSELYSIRNDPETKFTDILYKTHHSGILGSFYIKPKRGIRRPLGIFKLENGKKVRISQYRF